MARSKEHNERIKEERKDEIERQALLLFSSRGLSATKISDIAKAVGISQGLFYHYFKSKEELYVYLIKRGFANLNEACRWLEAQEMSPGEKISFALRELIKLLDEDENAARYHLLIAQASVSEAIPAEARTIIEKENKFPYASMAGIMARGQEAGEIKKEYSPEELALVFWTSINGLAIYRAVHGKLFTAPDSSILATMFLNKKITKEMSDRNAEF